jgi:hypothetical protein
MSTADDWDELEAEWNEDAILRGAPAVGDIKASVSSPLALPAEIQRWLLDPHNQRKREQLATGDLPSMLALLVWSFMRDGRSGLISHLLGYDKTGFVPAIYDGLPDQCQGILLCYFDLPLTTVTSEFLPAPARTMPPDIRGLLTSLGAVQPPPLS